MGDGGITVTLGGREWPESDDSMVMSGLGCPLGEELSFGSD